MKTFCFLTSLLLAALVCVPLHAQSIPDPDAKIDAIDKYFVSLNEAKRSIPQSTLQNWVGMQEAFHLLDLIMNDSNVGRETATMARYVAGYGFFVAELYDFAALLQERVLADAGDSPDAVRYLKDYANTLDKMGEFEKSSVMREKAMTLQGGTGSVWDYNNIAFTMLRAGHYDEAIGYVEKIDITEEDMADTRIFSARAYAYSGRYPEAAGELRKSCDQGESDACTMLETLENSSAPAEYWKSDRARKIVAWQPYNLIDNNLALAAAGSGLPSAPARSLSRFATSFWFNEIHLLYPDPRSSDIAYPETLPSGRMGFLLLEGVPLFAARIASPASEAKMLEGVKRFKGMIHTQSSWGKAMPIATKVLVMKLTGDRSYLAVVIHTSWQEALVRTLSSGTLWNVVE